jgi:cell fate regulator YaaT (PSP1 superfamily)
MIESQASALRNRAMFNKIAATRYLSLGGDPSVRANPRSPADPPARSANELTHRQNRMGAPVGAKLYLVSFKSNRADIFYLLPGFSFDPQPGDMVIVEGDRGHDLGIIQFANIDLETAKEKREEYNVRHYRTLTMFSRMFPHVAAASTAEQFDAPTAAIAGHNLGQPRRRQDGTDEPPPMKAIRRVANLDEIQMLQEKEGNEARAKRICQSKVTDHGIRMEILDAEFQVYVLGL